MFLRPTYLFAAAGVCWTAAQAALPDLGTEAADRYRHVAAARGRESLAAALFVIAAALLITAALSAMRLIGSGRGARLMSIGTVLTGIGGAWLAAGLGAFDLMFYSLTDPQVPRATALRLVDSSAGVARLPQELTLLCLLLGPLLLAIGLWRGRRATLLPLAAWVVGAVILAGFEFRVKAGEVAGLLIVTVALSLIGRALETPAVVQGSQSEPQSKPQPNDAASVTV